MNRRVEAPHSNRRDFENLAKISTYLWEYRGRVLFALTCLILAKCATVAVPLVLKEIINALDASSPEQQAITVVLGFVAAYGALRIASAAFKELRDSLFARVRYRAMHRLSTSVLSHLHDLSLAFHLERRTGSVSRDILRGTNSLSSIVNLLVFNIVPTIAEFLLVAFILFGGYGWHYTLVVAVTVLVYVVFTLKYSGWRMQFRHEMNRLESQATGRAVDSLLNYETVKYFNNEPLEQSAYDGYLKDWSDAGVKSQITMSTLNFGQTAIVTVGVTLIMMIAAGEVSDGVITLGDIVLINALMLQLFVPLNALGVVYRGLQYALADMDLVIRLLERTPDIQDKPDALALSINQASVEFDDVHFAYLSDRPILKGVSFSVKPGEKVAVGVDVRDCTQASLRSQLGVVPQDTVMFNESLQYNLEYASNGASLSDIKRAAKAANLDSFIEQLPAGFDTVVGERGLKLSGGEKQRVAIARVMLKAPPIIIFDEATSSLDSKTEKTILDGLNAAAEKATSLVIAHRLSTIIDADQILVLENGRIVERGNHQSLLSNNGLYAQMWSMQQEGDR